MDYIQDFWIFDFLTRIWTFSKDFEDFQSLKRFVVHFSGIFKDLQEYFVIF